MSLSLFLGQIKRLDRAVDQIVDAEERGFHAVWSGQTFDFDAMTALAVAGDRTQRIRLGTAVVPTWPRHPLVMAQQAMTVNQAAGGRFRLGIGPSHVPVVEDMLGIDFDRPILHVREYVEILRALMREGSVDFAGDQYRVKATVGVQDEQLPVYLSVLSEQMCRTAGRIADGAITWLAPPGYIASHVAPLVREGAEAEGRPVPPVVAAVPTACTDDADAARKTIRRLFAVYPMLPFYNAMMVKAGLPDAEAALHRGWSDELIDAVIPFGDAPVLAECAAAYEEAGADEVVYLPFPVGGDWSASLATTLDTLTDQTS